MGKWLWLLRRADGLIAGSHTLLKQAQSLGGTRDGIVVPTTVPAETWCPRPERSTGEFAQTPLRVGWVGTHSTAVSLRLVEGALRHLRAEGHEFEVRIVGGGEFQFRRLAAEYAPWTLETEREEFASMDIGLGPMLDNDWWRGKCAFKQVQYQCVGVPSVSSPIGAVNRIVGHNETGLLAESEKEWISHLRSLMVNAALRQHLSRGARRLAEEELCQEVQAQRAADFIATFLAHRR